MCSKLLFLLVLFSTTVLAETVQPERFIVVGVSGFGTRRPDNAWQPSAVHERLPEHSLIQSAYRLVHFASKAELKEVIDEFECNGGKQSQNDLGLIILANSWGSSKAIKLATKYKKICGRQADLFFMIDGVRKPLFANGTRPEAKKCYSYYQRKGVVRGKAIKGCENINYTKECIKRRMGPVACHIHVEWTGASRAAKEIKSFLNTF